MMPVNERMSFTKKGAKWLLFYNVCFLVYCNLESHMEAFMNKGTWVYKLHPTYNVLFGPPVPSSIGELSVTAKTRPVPYCAVAHIILVVLV
jgi:hypothetical protein